MTENLDLGRDTANRLSSDAAGDKAFRGIPKGLSARLRLQTSSGLVKHHGVKIHAAELGMLENEADWELILGKGEASQTERFLDTVDAVERYHEVEVFVGSRFSTE